MNGLGFSWNPLEWFSYENQGASESMIYELQVKSQQFMQAFGELQSNRDFAYSAGLGAEWDAIYNAASATLEKLNAAADAVSSAWGWAKSVFGLSGLKDSLSGLGALPLIPIAIVTAALAGVSYVLADMLQFNQRVSLMRAGYTAEQINQTLGESGSLGGMQKMILYGLLAVGAVVILPKLLEKK